MDVPGIKPKEDLTGKLLGNPDLCVFAATDYRGQKKRFGIKLDDRRRHMYVIGKTGMGKTTMLENMVLNDIYSGHGVGIVDPHGDFAEKIIDYIPDHRLDDVVYFNPADMEFPFGFNILENVNPDHKHLVVAGLMGVFKKIWPDVWSARMEYILNNTLLALLDYPGSTLLGVNRLLADRTYRKKVIEQIKDPIVKAFWTDEFAKYNERYQQEAIAPIQNKVGQFLSASIMRNVVAQVKSTMNIRHIMDTGKIFIMNLSKGRIGEDNSRLLGGMLITKIQLSAMERVDVPEKDRRDFLLYVDEFQNFASESFSNILSEARKYRLCLIMAHQFIEQLSEEVAAAVFGNVGTLISFRVGSRDAESLAKEFEPEFTMEDLVRLEKFHVYLKLMVDGVSTVPFSALTLAPIAKSTASTEKVIRMSRERYGTKRAVIEDKIMKWSGMMTEDESGAEETPKEQEPKKPAEPAAKPQLVNTHQPKEKPVAPRPPAPPKPQAHSIPKIQTPEPVTHQTENQPNPQPLTTIQFGALTTHQENHVAPTAPEHHAPIVQNVSFKPQDLVAQPTPRKEHAPQIAQSHQQTQSTQHPPSSTQTTTATSGEKKKRKRKRKKKPGSQMQENNSLSLEDSQPVTLDTTKAGEISLFNLKDT